MRLHPLLPVLAGLACAGPLHGLGLVSTSPGPGAPADTLLRFTCASEPRLGPAGRIRITSLGSGAVVETIDLAEAAPTRLVGLNPTPYRYRPVRVEGRVAVVHPRAGVLAAGGAYRVDWDAGVLTDASGSPLAAGSFSFSVRPERPAATAVAVTVAADGSGDFATVQGAIGWVPAGNTVPRVISIRAGVYEELVYLGSRQPFVTLRGEDRAGTVITYANNQNLNPGNNRAMVAIDAADVTLAHLSLRNTTPRGGSQAEALRGNGRRVVLDRVTLSSLQDTLLWNGSLFVTDSLIEGDVDFMWGGGACYFQRCELRSLGAGYLAQVRNGETGRGHVYVDCRLTAAPGVGNVYLARIDPRPDVANTWPFSEVVFLGCAIGPHVRPEGWLLNNATAAPQVRFGEFGSTDLSGGPLDLSRRLPDSRRIDRETAERYRDPAFVLGWSPPAPVTPPPRRERLTGLSTRARAGAEPVIVGFVLAGAAEAAVLMRGAGPALGAFGVSEVLPRPRLVLQRDGTVLAAQVGGPLPEPVASAAARLGLFPFRSGAADTALLATLRPGAYTVALADAGGAEGNGLVEIYDATPGEGSRRLANLSSRALVGEGDATLISGLTVAGSAPKPVLVRGIGPALTAFGVEGALARPRLTVYRGTEALAVNAGWTAADNPLEIARAGAGVGAFPLATGSADTALLLELAPGNYTAQVSGPPGSGGVALLEVYEVP
ncbi:MAG: hypothetical protein FJ397_03110 [Verrucomicrobia bacterium]|nr:hypothetical protein [Verrucomicrobiota bacterium]